MLRRSKRIGGGASYSSIAKEYELHNTNVSGVEKNEDKKKFASGSYVKKEDYLPS